MFHSEDSAIIFSNKDQTVFVIDTPHSIAQAQTLSSHHHQPHSATSASEKSNLNSALNQKKRKHLLSTTPLAAPYPSTTEPKSASARAKVLARISENERRFHEAILLLAVDALTEIKKDFNPSSGEWCLPRFVATEEPLDYCAKSGNGENCNFASSKKRPRTDSLNRKSSTRKGQSRPRHSSLQTSCSDSVDTEPPVILSSTAPNIFETLSELDTIVKNPSNSPATLLISQQDDENENVNDQHEDQTSSTSRHSEYIIPPYSIFRLGTIPLSNPNLNSMSTDEDLRPIPGITPNQKFNLILLDPPWPNKSVRRSGHYSTHPYADMDSLTHQLTNLLKTYAYTDTCQESLSNPDPFARESNSCSRRGDYHGAIAAIWITNAEKARRAAYEMLASSGFCVCEEWVWVKVTKTGEPICPVDGLWRKPYEILVIGRREESSGSAKTDVDVAANVHAEVEAEADADADAIPRVNGSGSAVNTNSATGIHAEAPTIGSKSESDFPVHWHSDLAGRNEITRRVIAAVPDIHSRKPNLRELFERVFFCSGSRAQNMNSSSLESRCEYSALEVFARNLTAGWWCVGNEVLKFNSRECWVDGLEEEEEDLLNDEVV